MNSPIRAAGEIMSMMRDVHFEISGERKRMQRVIHRHKAFLEELISSKTPHSPFCTFEHEVNLSCNCFKADAVALLADKGKSQETSR